MSTENSTPEKANDTEMTLWTEMHRNLISCDSVVDSPLEGHKVTKEYRTKMVDWMVEVTTSFKCT